MNSFFQKSLMTTVGRNRDFSGGVKKPNENSDACGAHTPLENTFLGITNSRDIE